MINKNIFVVIALLGVLFVAACSTGTAPAPVGQAQAPSGQGSASAGSPGQAPVQDSLGTDLSNADSAAANDTLVVNESDLDLG